MTALIVISLVGIATLFGGVFNWKGKTLWFAVAGLMATLVLNFMDWNTGYSYFNQMVKFDNYALAFNGILLTSTLLIMLLCSHHYRNVAQSMIADIYGL
ncbi:MAG: hypothetical protein KBG24_12580, partial [Bacteroidia bacterium]|nr:hypothetical protein [Bacteroidia bacterium]